MNRNFTILRSRVFRQRTPKMVRPTALFGNCPLGTEDVVCVSRSRHEARMGEPKNQATGTAALLAVQRENAGRSSYATRRKIRQAGGDLASHCFSRLRRCGVADRRTNQRFRWLTLRLL